MGAPCRLRCAGAIRARGGRNCPRLHRKDHLLIHQWSRYSRATPARAVTRETPPAAQVRVLFAAGGTGGHVFPAIAVAQALQRLAPGAVRVDFVGGDRIERSAVPNAGFPFHRVPAPALRRPWRSLSNALLPFRLAWALIRCLALSLRLRPDVVVGTGGFQSFPACVVAALCGVPVAIIEPNALPGLANRVLSRFAKVAFLAFPAAEAGLHGRCGVRVTGCPVREEVAAVGVGLGGRSEGVGGGSPHILVLGGSLGAPRLTEAAAGAMRRLQRRYPDLRATVQTGRGRGRGGLGDLQASVQAGQAEGWCVNGAGEGTGEVMFVEFVDDVAGALRKASLAICRAGAVACAELACAGCPSILVPSPHVTDNHQDANATAMASAGAAVVVNEGPGMEDALVEVCGELLSDPARLSAMSHRALAAARPKAALDIAEAVLEMAGRETGSRGNTGNIGDPGDWSGVVTA